MSRSRSKTFEPVNTIVDILCADKKEPNWLIPNLLLQGAVICLAGEAGAGKSYISYTLALAIASGSPALSGMVPAGEPKRVLYFDEENGEQDKNTYLQRSWVGLGRSNGQQPDLALLDQNFWTVSFHLGTEDWQDRARAWIEFVQPHLVVFDTATPAFNIVNENDNGEATQAVKDVRRLIAIPDETATALVLKHSNIRTEKGGRRTIRGAKAWKGSTDGMLFQVRAGGRPRKDSLALTKLEPDKIRAWGLPRTLYITPKWTDVDRTGLMLNGAYGASKDHQRAEREEDRELDNAARRR